MVDSTDVLSIYILNQIEKKNPKNAHPKMNKIISKKTFKF